MGPAAVNEAGATLLFLRLNSSCCCRAILLQLFGQPLAGVHLRFLAVLSKMVQCQMTGFCQDLQNGGRQVRFRHIHRLNPYGFCHVMQLNPEKFTAHAQCQRLIVQAGQRFQTVMQRLTHTAAVDISTKPAGCFIFKVKSAADKAA